MGLTLCALRRGVCKYLEHAELEERFDGHNLVLPGRILHLVKRGTKKRRCCHSCRRCSLCHTKRVYQARCQPTAGMRAVRWSVGVRGADVVVCPA